MIVPDSSNGRPHSGAGKGPGAGRHENRQEYQYMGQKLSILQEAIHYQFRQVKLLETALAHSSYINEVGGEQESNERLEFLGDAVLELVVSDRLFTLYPEAHEGELTRMRARLVREGMLASIARELGLERHLLLGRGEESQGGRTRDSLLSDALEALLGAVFLDGGYETARGFILDLFDGKWPRAHELPRAKDFKSLLQELTQRRFRDRPVYTLIGSSGPEHSKIFEVKVDLPSGQSLMATGPNLKTAQQMVARAAIELLGPDEPGTAPDQA
jgi:ribonuclease-3